MARYRQLPSKKWQATVTLPNGRRITNTDPLKRIVKEWAEKTEVEIRRGRWRDPKVAQFTVGEWRDKFTASRLVELETERADIGSWNLHLKAHFQERPLRDVTRTEVQTWVKERVNAGVGPAAIRRALNLLKTMLEAATVDGHLDRNPAKKVEPPAQPPRLPDWYTLDEVSAITHRMSEADRFSDAVMTELMCWAGPRWGETAALHGTDVDWLRGFISINRTMMQSGKEKPYPKNSSSIREVPAPKFVLDRMAQLLIGRDPGELIFVTKRQARPLSGANWRTMFDDMRSQAGVDHGTPHTCRHTCASWLVQDGVPLYDVQRQLGHASMTTTMIYAHLAPDNHAQVLRAWQNRASDAHGGVVVPLTSG